MNNADFKGILKGFSDQLYVIQKAVDVENTDMLVIKGLIESVSIHLDMICHRIELDELNKKEQENER